MAPARYPPPVPPGASEGGRETDPRIARAIVGAILDNDRSGYEIWRWLGATHGSRGTDLSESNLYPILHHMEAEGLIAGHWSEEDEGDRIRRVYRVAAKGSTAASRQGLHPLGHPLAADPESVAADTKAGAAAPEDSDAAAEAASPPPPADAAEFLDRLDKALRLSEPHRTDTRSEIRDHLEDSAAGRIRTGMSPDVAARAALTAMGSPEALGKSVSRVETTRRRLGRGIAAGIMATLFGAGIGLAVGATAILLLPLAGRALVGFLGGMGMHLYLPDTMAWRSEQLALAGAIGAFIGARRSTPALARVSRRQEHSVRLPWAVAGGIAFGFIALTSPARLDPVTAIALLAMPAGFFVGAMRFQGLHDDLVSRSGIVQAAALVLVLMFVPGGRTWFFSPTSTAPAAPAAAQANGAIVWRVEGNATFVDVAGLDPQWHDARVQFWPAAMQGIGIGPDVAATSFTFDLPSGSQVPLDNNMIKSVSHWWVVLTAIGPDGARHTLTAEPHPGYDSERQRTLLGWLLGDR